MSVDFYKIEKVESEGSAGGQAIKSCITCSTVLASCCGGGDYICESCLFLLKSDQVSDCIYKLNRR